MALRARITALEKDLTLAFPELTDPKERSRVIAEYATEEKAKADAQNKAVLGNVPPHEVYVDGRQNAPFSSVKPDGRIIVEYELLEDVLVWIDQQLFTHSPWLTGRYSRSHVLLIDGVAHEPTDDVIFKDEAFFANVQPYARKIERGLSKQAPDGVYDVIATLAQKRFGNLVRIRFGYRSLMFGGIDAWAAKTGMVSKSKGKRREDWLRRQPAIIITHR